MTLLITGANGFIGATLLNYLEAGNVPVRTLSRTRLPLDTSSAQDSFTKHSSPIDTAMHGISVIIHLAARAHVLKDSAASPLSAYREANVDYTVALANAAVAHGVRRFVFVSSIKVNGDSTSGDYRYTEHSPPTPQDPYSISKWEAEQALMQISAATGLELVILRPPLVYGPGVKGNFAQLLSIVKHGIPLPFASISNRRDLIFVNNLVDALVACATHPAAAGKTYLVSDGCSISTPALVDYLASSMGLPKRTFRFPPQLLRLIAKIAGKSAQAERLLDSLQIDSDKIRRELGWIPPYTLQQGLQLTAQAYLAKRK